MLGARESAALTLFWRVGEEDTVSVGDVAVADPLCELVGVVGGVGSCERVELDASVRGTIATGEAGERSGDAGGVKDTAGRGGRVVDLRVVEGEGESSITVAEDGNEGLRLREIVMGIVVVSESQ